LDIFEALRTLYAVTWAVKLVAPVDANTKISIGGKEIFYNLTNLFDHGGAALSGHREAWSVFKLYHIQTSCNLADDALCAAPKIFAPSMVFPQVTFSLSNDDVYAFWCLDLGNFASAHTVRVVEVAQAKHAEFALISVDNYKHDDYKGFVLSFLIYIMDMATAERVEDAKKEQHTYYLRGNVHAYYTSLTHKDATHDKVHLQAYFDEFIKEQPIDDENVALFVTQFITCIVDNTCDGSKMPTHVAIDTADTIEGAAAKTVYFEYRGMGNSMRVRGVTKEYDNSIAELQSFLDKLVAFHKARATITFVEETATTIASTKASNRFDALWKRKANKAHRQLSPIVV
jgi:hypothetical protein